jgi:hypothetical protein
LSWNLPFKTLNVQDVADTGFQIITKFPAHKKRLKREGVFEIKNNNEALGCVLKKLNKVAKAVFGKEKNFLARELKGGVIELSVWSDFVSKKGGHTIVWFQQHYSRALLERESIAVDFVKTDMMAMLRCTAMNYFRLKFSL